MSDQLSIPVELIEKAQNTDQEAFGEIFELFMPPMFRFVLFSLGDEKMAEDMTESIFLKIWKDLKKFRVHGKTPFHAWALQIARHTITPFLEKRKKNIQNKKKHEASGQKSQEQGQDLIEQHHLILAFDDLPRMQAESVILKYFCHIPNSSIALILEKTEGAVRILQSRGLKRLREVLE